MKPLAAILTPTRALDAQKDAKSAGTLLTSQEPNPEAGPGNEALAAPPWVVGTLGGAVVLAGVMYFVWRARSARRPPSGPASVRPAAGKIR